MNKKTKPLELIMEGETIIKGVTYMDMPYNSDQFKASLFRWADLVKGDYDAKKLKTIINKMFTFIYSTTKDTQLRWGDGGYPNQIELAGNVDYNGSKLEIALGGSYEWDPEKEEDIIDYPLFSVGEIVLISLFGELEISSDRIVSPAKKDQLWYLKEYADTLNLSKPVYTRIFGK